VLKYGNLPLSTLDSRINAWIEELKTETKVPG